MKWQRHTLFVCVALVVAVPIFPCLHVFDVLFSPVLAFQLLESAVEYLMMTVQLDSQSAKRAL